MDENRLIEEALNNREAAEKLIRLHYGEVYRYIYKRTLNNTLTDDLTQEVFLYVLKHLSSFRRKSPFIVWVLRIATSFINEHYRKENKYLKLKEDIKPSLLLSPSTNDPIEGPSIDTYRIIHEHLQHLPPSYQTIITLKFFEKRKTKEICAIMHKTPVGVRVTLHRALNALKRDIEDSVTDLDFLRLYGGEEEEWPTSTPKNKGKEEIR